MTARDHAGGFGGGGQGDGVGSSGERRGGRPAAGVWALAFTMLALLGACSTTDAVPAPSPIDAARDTHASADATVDAAVTEDAGDAVDAAVDSADDGAVGDAGPTIQLKIAWWGSQDRHDRTLKVLQLFSQKHPEIQFTTEPMPVPSTDYWTLMGMRRDAQMLPDIMQQDYSYIGEWASKGLLVPIDDLARPGGTIDTADVAPTIIDGGRIGGKLYGISLGSNTQCFILDTDAFKNAGVELPPDTWTWSDFETIANTIHTKLDMWAYGSALYLYTPWKALYLSQGGWVWSPDNMNVGFTDDAPWVNHWKMLIRLMKSGAILPYDDEQSMFPSADIEKQPIVTQKSAMEQIQSNQLLALWTAAGATRNFKLVPIPRLTGGGPSVYVKPSQFFSIVAGTQHPTEAAMLIDFFTNDIEANQLLAAERGVPVAGKVLAALKPTLGPGQVGAFDLLDRVAKDARPLPLPDPPQWNDILNMVYKPHVTVPVLHETIIPEEGVAIFHREATALLHGMAISDGGVAGDGASDAEGTDAGAGDAGDDAAAAHALLIVGAVPLVGNDVPLHDQLAAKLPVDVIPEAMATTADATGKALVVITATASVAGTMTKFRDVTTPVILMEPNLMPAMRFTADTPTAHGTVAAQTQIAINDATSPLAAGFPAGNVTVYTAPWRAVFGTPAAGAITAASVVGAANQATIFGYPAGGAMVGGTAAAGKRLALFIHNSATANVSADGLKLFDAAVTWSIAP